MRSALLLVLMLVGGCDIVFSLDRPPDDATSDSSPTGVPVTVRVGVDVITPTASGGYETAYEPLATAVTVVLADGSRPAVTQIDDRYEFLRADEAQPYRITYTPPLGAVATTYIGDVAELTIVGPLFGRLQRGTVPAMTRAMISHTTTTRTAFAISTGLRTQTKVNDSPTATSSVLLDWLGVESLSGPRGLPAAAQNDRLHHATYDLIGGVGAYYTMATLASVPLTLDPGVTTPLTMPVPAATTRSCVQLTAKRARELQRMTAALGAFDSMRSTWSIEATPVPDRTATGGIYLAYEDTTPSSDPPQVVSVGNPFASEGMVAHLTASGVIDLGGVSTTVETSTYAAVPPLACTPTVPALVLEGATGFATEITVDGQLTTGPVSVSEGRIAWTLVDGAADSFVVEIVEVGVANPRGSYVTSARELVVDPGVFESGRRYFIRIATQSGQVGASVGDFRALTYPNGRTVAPSRVFRVQ